MTLRKLDDKGNYTKFPGVTIAASVKEEDCKFWKNIYDTVVKCNCLKEYYAPLPYTSYHMTVINLYTENSIGSDKWKNFVLNQRIFFQSLQKVFTNKIFNLEITVERIEITNVIQIVVNLTKEQEKIVHQIAEEYSISTKIPFPYHITLAYQFKFLEGPELEQISIHGAQLFLDQPKLCSFNDMSAFIPWDGLEFPFEDCPYSFFKEEPETQKSFNFCSAI